MQKIPNPEELQREPSLNSEALIKIYFSSIMMEGFFQGQPTDIEGVWKDGKVHFVQARSVNRKAMVPTYLKASSQDMLQATSLVVGKASVVSITSPREVVVATTLDAAEHLAEVNPDLKLVIVTRPEPGKNTHSLVNFSGRGIPCLYVSPEEGEKVKTWIKTAMNEGHPLVSCVQTATLHFWDETRDGKVHRAIESGFGIHPAQIALSLDVTQSSHFLSKVEPSKELHKFVKELRRTDGARALEILEQITFHPKLGELSIAIQKLETEIKSPEALEQLNKLKNLEKSIFQAIQEIGTLLDRKPEDRLRRLLHINMLEALLVKSEVTSEMHLGQYSLKDLPVILQSIQAFEDYKNALGHTPHYIDLLPLGFTGNDEIFGSWKLFLLHLESLHEKGQITEEDASKIKDFFKTLSQTKTFASWSMIFFKSKDFEAQVQDLLRISPEELDFLHRTQQLQQAAESIKKDIDLFGDPKSFAQSWSQLKKHTQVTMDLVADITSHPYSSLAHIVACQTILETVDLLDSAAKTVKSSHSFEGRQIALFKEILVEDNKLMKSLTSLVSKKTLSDSDNDSEYFNTIDALLQARRTDTLATSELLPSSDFSVSAAKIGSHAIFSRHLPRTSEDLLTLFHQNCITLVSMHHHTLTQSLSLEKSNIPKTLLDTMNAIESHSDRIQKMGMQITDKEIIVSYNVPLRRHSGHLTLRYSLLDGKMSLVGQLLGEARSRWQETKEWLSIVEQTSSLEFERPMIHTEQELSVFWKVTSQEELTQILAEYISSADYSLNAVGNYVRTKISEKLTNSNALNTIVFIKKLIVVQPTLLLSVALSLLPHPRYHSDLQDSMMLSACFAAIFLVSYYITEVATKRLPNGKIKDIASLAKPVTPILLPIGALDLHSRITYGGSAIRRELIPFVIFFSIHSLSFSLSDRKIIATAISFVTGTATLMLVRSNTHPITAMIICYLALLIPASIRYYKKITEAPKIDGLVIA